MSAEQLLREGRLNDALAALKDEVRKDAATARHRVFLFQMFAIQGEWARALNHLNVAAELDPAALAMAQMYREAIRCESLRAEIFAGKRSPIILGEPPAWLGPLAQVLPLLADRQFAAASALRDEAFTAAPASAGTLFVADPDAAETTGETTPPGTRAVRFEWLADADSRLGPIIEAVVNGRYYWVPVANIRRIDIEAPVDLRDKVWMPVHFVWNNGGDVVGLIPTRYAGSESSSDEQIRLARKTDWAEVNADWVFGQGQRMLATDAGEFALMDVRRIQFENTSGQS